MGGSFLLKCQGHQPALLEKKVPQGIFLLSLAEYFANAQGSLRPLEAGDPLR
jgi:hypothetical protein